MAESSERERSGARPFGQRAPVRAALLPLAAFLLLCAVFGVPSYFIAVDRGAVDTWWIYLACFLGFLAIGFVIGAAVAFRRAYVRRRRMISTATRNLTALGKSHPHAFVAGSLHLRGLGEGLQQLGLPAPGRVSMIAVVADPTGLGIWSIDSRPRLIASIPTEVVGLVEYRRPKASAKYLILFAVATVGDAVVDLPLLFAPLAPKHTSEPGRRLVRSLLEEALRHGTHAIPDGVNGWLATEAEAAAIRSATVPKPALAIDESGAVDDRPELR